MSKLLIPIAILLLGGIVGAQRQANATDGRALRSDGDQLDAAMPEQPSEANEESTTLGNRELELRRQETLQDAAMSRQQRRLDMEARRFGRLPPREQERLNQRRLRCLSDNSQSGENEIDATGEAVSERQRNFVLIEEEDGKLLLVDLGTADGRKKAIAAMASRKQTKGKPQEMSADQGETSKLKLKQGQL